MDVTIVTHGWTDGHMKFEVGLEDKDLSGKCKDKHKHKCDDKLCPENRYHNPENKYRNLENKYHNLESKYHNQERNWYVWQTSQGSQCRIIPVRVHSMARL